MKALRDDAEVVVAELLAEVIAWNAEPEYGISVEAMSDPRVRVIQDDVINVLRNNPAGFNAIMLDTDNGPAGMLMSESERLYEPRGVKTTLASLRPGGRVAYWSVGDDPRFKRALRGANLSVETLQVARPRNETDQCIRSTRALGVDYRLVVFAADFFAPDFFALDFFALDFFALDFFAPPSWQTSCAQTSSCSLTFAADHLHRRGLISPQSSRASLHHAPVNAPRHPVH